MSESTTLIADSIQRILADSVSREVLDAAQAGVWPAALWNVLEESGFHRVLDDAAGGDWQDAQAVLFALGYHRAPVPLAETLLANCLCARAGLPVEDGPATVVDGSELVFEQGQGEDQLLLTGSAALVPWARFARRMVIAGWHDGRAMLAVAEAGASGLLVQNGLNIAGEARDNLSFQRTPVTAVPCDLVPGHNAVRLYGALLRAVCMAGAATSVLDQSVLYVNDRVQFGRPLAKFQAVQHLLAELGSEAAAGTMAAAAACAVAEHADAALEIAIAKVRTGQMATRVARIAHQVHGAIGFTHEHSLHYGTQRLWSWRSEYGNESSWARLIGLVALATGGEQLWSGLMTRKYE
jgi:acyl-CoA dehydrogenase